MQSQTGLIPEAEKDINMHSLFQVTMADSCVPIIYVNDEDKKWLQILIYTASL